MNKIKLFTFFVLTAAMVWVWGCGDDSTTGGNNTPGTAPTLNMKVGSVYAFTVDSLDTNGSVRSTKLKTFQSIVAQGTFFSESNAFAIKSETRDTSFSPSVLVDSGTFYVKYEGGIFKQYGLVKLIDSTQLPTWDVVADFNLATGTQWQIATINTTINGFNVSANIKGAIKDNIAFTTNNTGQSINNFRTEITAEVTALTVPAGTIFVDYYLGYADPSTNPSGPVRFKLRPIWLQAASITLFRSAGMDQKIDYYVIP